jgi:hypothetical protein
MRDVPKDRSGRNRCFFQEKIVVAKGGGIIGIEQQAKQVGKSTQDFSGLPGLTKLYRM